MTETYFFDTYAIVEILRSNGNYLEYINKNAIITKLNIFEVFYNIMRDFGKDKAKKAVDQYYPSVIEFGRSVIEEAAEFRLLHKKRDVSMTDCIGYIIAKKMGIKFLTGDEQFKDLPNVEFVK